MEELSQLIENGAIQHQIEIDDESVLKIGLVIFLAVFLGLFVSKLIS